MKYLGNVEVAELFELDQGVKGLFNILQEKITHNWQQRKKITHNWQQQRKSLTIGNKTENHSQLATKKERPVVTLTLCRVRERRRGVLSSQVNLMTSIRYV